MTGLGILLVALLPLSLQAQSVGRDLENGFKDMTHIWSAPARVSGRDLPVIGALSGGVAALMLVDRPVYEWIKGHPTSLPVRLVAPFREDQPLSLLGRSFILAGGSAVMYIAGWVADSRDLREAGIGCMSATTSATAARGVLNHIVGRTRPRLEKGPFVFELFHNDWNKRSFPGGHAAHIMSCVSFWNQRFDLGAAEPVLYAVAAGVGWARIVDGAHWPSDTFAGSAYGWAIGKGIADRYQRRELDRRPGFVLQARVSF